MRGSSGTLFSLRSLALLLLLLHTFYSIAINSPSFRSQDENAYVLMTINFVRHGTVLLDNGYREYPSPLFRYHTDFYPISPAGGLALQYPPFYPIMASPFYMAFGIDGMFYMNAVLYVLTATLIFKIAFTLFGDEWLSYLSAFIFVLGTFSWPYSQTVLSHVATTFLLILSLHLVTKCYFQKEREGGYSKKLLLLSAGFLVGVAVGCRLDSIFFFPVLAYLPLFARKKIKFNHLAWGALGALPPILLLSLINHYKFGTFNPFSYGSSYGNRAGSASTYTPYFFAALIYALVFGWLLLQRRLPKSYKRLWRQYKYSYLGFSVAAVAVFLAWKGFTYGQPQVLEAFARSYYILVFDYRPPFYNHTMVRSLLITMPYLPALLLLCRMKADIRIEALLIPVFTYGVMFTLLGDHGWIASHPRYYYPMLPTVSILAAYLWHHKSVPVSKRLLWALLVCAIAIFAIRHITMPRNLDVHNSKLFLVLPGITFLLVFVLTMQQIASPSKRVAKSLAYVTFFGACWSGIVVFCFDTVAMFHTGRYTTYKEQMQIAEKMPPNALVITRDNGGYCVPFHIGLKDGLIAAYSFGGDKKKVADLVEHYLREGKRPVYIDSAVFAFSKLSEKGFVLNRREDIRSKSYSYSRIVGKRTAKNAQSQ